MAACFNCGQEGHWVRDCSAPRGKHGSRGGSGAKHASVGQGQKRRRSVSPPRQFAGASIGGGSGSPGDKKQRLLSDMFGSQGPRTTKTDPTSRQVTVSEANSSARELFSAWRSVRSEPSSVATTIKPKVEFASTAMPTGAASGCTAMVKVSEVAEAADRPRLSLVQEAGVVAFVDGMKNVFITGSAGTGKSFLVHELRTRAAATGARCYTTASTGAAAMLLGGMTLHAFAGVGLAQESAEALLTRVRKNKAACERLCMCDCLVIDEVSMIDGNLWDKIEFVARKIRGCAQPFGGIRLAVCGDFFQLPPVAKRDPETGAERPLPFAFEAVTWRTCIRQVVLLTDPFRQADSEFVRILETIRRRGPDVEAAVATLNDACVGRVFPAEDDCVEATTLYPHRGSADAENIRRLAMLPGDATVFVAHDAGSEPYIGQLQKACNAPERLELKVGAQVVLLRNLSLELGLCNGARGCVVGFTGGRGAEVAESGADGSGGGGGAVVMNPARNPAMGAASGASGGAGGGAVIAPIVQFACGVRMSVQPSVWEISKPGPRGALGSVVASRNQTPLMLAWALSIHKCQGMTLDRVQMNLLGVFEFGQAYVALSRARSLEALRLMAPIPAAVIRANPAVIKYYEQPF